MSTTESGGPWHSGPHFLLKGRRGQSHIAFGYPYIHSVTKDPAVRVDNCCGVIERSFGGPPFPSSIGVFCWGQPGCSPRVVEQSESQNFWPTILVAGNR